MNHRNGKVWNVFEHVTAGILDLLRRSFLLNDSLLDYELLWTLTNLTAILQPKEIEFLFGPEGKNQNAATFIIQKLTSIIASSDDGQCKRLPLCCLACWAIGNILGPFYKKSPAAIILPDLTARSTNSLRDNYVSWWHLTVWPRRVIFSKT